MHRTKRVKGRSSRASEGPLLYMRAMERAHPEHGAGRAIKSTRRRMSEPRHRASGIGGQCATAWRIVRSPVRGGGRIAALASLECRFHRLGRPCHPPPRLRAPGGAGYTRIMPNHAITLPLPEALRDDAAALFLLAFESKLGPVLGRGPRARRFLAECLDPAQAIAVLEGGRLLGFAGVRDGSGAFMGGGMAELARHYGMLGGVARGLLLAKLERAARPGVLLVEGICVAAPARGRGIGVALLHALAAEGRRRGAHELRLEVVDTNPRAAALYARAGFREAGRTELGLWRHLYGFRTAIAMTLPL